MSYPLLAVLGVAISLFPSGVTADCWYDRFGEEHCNLSTGARAGVAIGIIAVILFILIAATAVRRRRIAAANAAFIPQHNGASANAPYVNPSQPSQYNTNHFPNGNYNPFNNGTGGYAPQYPPPHHGSPGSGYDPASGFAPPMGPPPAHHSDDAPPPQYYPPPTGPPPIPSDK